MGKKRSASKLRRAATVAMRSTITVVCLGLLGWMLTPYFQAERVMDELRIAVIEDVEGEDFPAENSE